MELLTLGEIGRLTPSERLAVHHEQVRLTDAQEMELDRRLGSLDDDRRDAGD